MMESFQNPKSTSRRHVNGSNREDLLKSVVRRPAARRQYGNGDDDEEAEQFEILCNSELRVSKNKNISNGNRYEESK
jgi:hypothetical protein